jgi:diguanylate cyclase (GGDEF)-like protein
MSVLSLYERAAALFSTLSLEPLAERLVEGLCLETRAQGGVLWIARDLGSQSLRLAAARGLIRVEEEPEALEASRLGQDLAPVAQGGRSFVANVARGGNETEALYVPLRRGSELLGLARLSDKLDGAAFNDRDRVAAEKFVDYGSQALENALRFHGLERRSFRDPTTKAYTRAYFEDVVRNEIQKAGRFGHRFSLIHVQIDGMAEFRRTLSETDFSTWLESLVQAVGGGLRSTDLLATLDVSRTAILLPETDGLGAAVLKQRVREVVDESGILKVEDGAQAPKLVLATATYPTDGTQLEALDRTLEERLAQSRESRVTQHVGEERPLSAAIDLVLRDGEQLPAACGAQITRFLIEEVGRRPRDRGLVFLSPGDGLMAAVHGGLEQLDGQDVRSELVLVGEKGDGADWDLPLTWVTPGRLDTRCSFILSYGDGPAYALVGDPRSFGKGGSICHTADRSLVEHLVFQLQRDLGIPLGV